MGDFEQQCLLSIGNHAIRLLEEKRADDEKEFIKAAIALIKKKLPEAERKLINLSTKLEHLADEYYDTDNEE